MWVGERVVGGGGERGGWKKRVGGGRSEEVGVEVVIKRKGVGE